MLSKDVLCCPDLYTLVCGFDYFSTYAPASSFSGCRGAAAAHSTDQSSAQASNYKTTTFCHDALLSLALNFSRHRNDEKRKVCYVAGFLDGEARRWYVQLLRANVSAYFERERERSGQRAVALVPRLEAGIDWPSYWASYEFIIDELSSVDNFLDALSLEFPDAVPTTPPTPEDRAHTPRQAKHIDLAQINNLLTDGHLPLS